MNDRVVQEGNVAGGHIVAGNMDNRQTTIVIPRPQTQLGALIEQLREKIQADQEAAEFVESLRSWINPKKTDLNRDLATKLTDCGKGHLISDATEAKERFHKQLSKNMLYPAVQEIYAYILGEIYTSFNHLIKPKIGSSKIGETEAAIVDLANSITSQIANAPPSLGIGMTEVTGMLYFLTGNCHIDWDYNAPLPPSN